MTPASYEELDDLPSLVNWLRAFAENDGLDAFDKVAIANAATAITGLMIEVDASRIALECERTARRIADAAAARALAQVKAANDDMRPW